MLGAFFNGVFLLALGVSIFLQSIERFICPEDIHQPLLMLIMGCVGVGTNLICILLVHEHHHDHKPHTQPLEPALPIDLADIELNIPVTTPPLRSHQHDLGINAVFIHILGDILNNLGVIAAALLMMLLKSPNRFYADPALSMAIAIMIFCSALPLTRESGHILLGSIPPDFKLADLTHSLKAIPGVVSVHELRVWRLNQDETIASAHVVVSPLSSENTSPRSSSPPIRPLSSKRRSSESMIAMDELNNKPIGAETSNERLKRIRMVFDGFGIRDITLQVEDHSTEQREAEESGSSTCIEVTKSCNVEISSV